MKNSRGLSRRWQWEGERIGGYILAGSRQQVLRIGVVTAIARQLLRLPWLRRYGGNPGILCQHRYLQDKVDKGRCIRWPR